MIENVLQQFSDKIFSLLTDTDASVDRDFCVPSVKKHSEKLQTNGDFSLNMNYVKYWYKYLKRDDNTFQVCDDANLLTFIGKNQNDLIEDSGNWILRIHRVERDSERVILFLDRPLAITVGLAQGLRNNELIALRLGTKLNTVNIDEACESSSCPTALRVKLFSDVIRNLCTICESSPEVVVTSRSTYKSKQEYVFLCGTVLNAKTGTKETTITSEDFTRIRQAELSLIAQHKYGVRVTSDSKWKEFLAFLGESAVAFELLQAKMSGAVKINFENGATGSSKGASFVLYNCARIETIIKTYNDKVESGVYPALPNIEDVDFTLLTLEDEWTLIFNYILGFPSMLVQSVEISGRFCDFQPHHICSFLSAMVRVVSQYYRRTRILVEPRSHLLPTIYARIHMLKVLNDILKTCLKILNIKSVSQM